MKTCYNLLLALIITLSVTFLISCESCVKRTSKKITNVGLSAVEGVIEAVGEKGEQLAEKVTDVAGKAAVGIGKSLEKQLNEHATAVASVAGRTMVQTLDGLAEGLDTELANHYDAIPYTEDLASGVALTYFVKYKQSPVVDAYFIITDDGEYSATFECYDREDKVFLTKNIHIDSLTNDKSKEYTLVSFALNDEEVVNFKNVKNVKITVVKK